MAIIGISCFYHDSAAAVVGDNGEILAAVQEERLSRKKNDDRFPYCSVDYCIKIAKQHGEKINSYVYYEKPIRVFMRLLETYFYTAPRGITSFLPAMKLWLNKKLFTSQKLIKYLSNLDDDFKEEKLYFSEHHLSHASSAFFPSPYPKAAILCMDAVGEWVTTSAWVGKDNIIKPLWEINFPDSIGMLYSAFTYYCGFKVNSGEYKLMGLAPYGKPIYKDIILNKIIDLKEDGSFKLNMKYFKYQRGLRMISKKFIDLFGSKPRQADEEIRQFHMDIAASIQHVVEVIIVKIARNLKKETKEENLCIAGGVALNCVANSKLISESGFSNVWIQPASGDSGSALGSALAIAYLKNKVNRRLIDLDSMKSSYLGPSFSDIKIKGFLERLNINYESFEEDELCDRIAKAISLGNVIGWFQGKMEYGPRALGNRSILGDPRNPDMQNRMNLKIKFRESFRPFAPAILEEYIKDYFDMDFDSPYMLVTSKINSKYSKEINNQLEGFEQLKQIRSVIPSVTHIDKSSRIQSVSKRRNYLFYNLIDSFRSITGCPALINTSFNIRGEPIVCTPQDALRCFIYTNIDILVLGGCVIERDSLPNDIQSKFKKPLQIKD